MAVNQPPLANPDFGALTDPPSPPGFASTGGNVLANDSDPEGGTLTVTGFQINGVNYTVGGATTPYGSFFLNSGGVWSYSVLSTNGPLSALKPGETADEVITYTVRDAAGATSTSTLTVTFTGINDKPVVNGNTGNGEEGQGIISVPLWYSATDPDGDTLTVVEVGALPPGFSIDYVNNRLVVDQNHAAYDSLPEGSYLMQTVTYKVSDGTNVVDATVKFGLNGRNDAPRVAQQPINVTEGGAILTVNPWDHVYDVDAGTVLTARLSFLQNGVTYDAATNLFHIDPTHAFYDSIAAGQTKTYAFAIYASDGAPYNHTTHAVLNYTVTGVNDAPTAFADSGSATEAGASSGTNASGNVLTNDKDVDTGDTKLVTGLAYNGETVAIGTAFKAAYGTITLNANGAYTYVVDNSLAVVNALAPGQNLQETFSYTMADGSGATAQANLTITINGANDVPVTSGQLTLVGVEGGATVAIDALTGASDPEGAALTVSYGFLPPGISYDATNKRFVLDPSNSVFNRVKEGGTGDGTVNFTISDGVNAVAQSIRYTVQGTNDAPAATNDLRVADESNVNPVTRITGNILANDTDPDDGDTKTVVSVTWNGQAVTIGQAFFDGYGALTLQANGAYEYTMDNTLPQVNALAHLQGPSQNFIYVMQDGSGATSSATFTIINRGVNDAPVATPLTYAATEGTGPVVFSAVAGAFDPDVPSNPLQVRNITPTAGLTYQNGARTFTFDTSNPAYNSLKAGEVLTLTVRFDVTDSLLAAAPNTLTLTITGTNDAPVAPNLSGGTVAEGSGVVTLDALQGATDVDNGAVLSVVAPTSLPDGVSYADGVLTLDASHAAFDDLGSGESRLVTVTYGVTDGEATTQRTASWTVTGVNDAPTALRRCGHDGREAGGEHQCAGQRRGSGRGRQPGDLRPDAGLERLGHVDQQRRGPLHAQRGLRPPQGRRERRRDLHLHGEGRLGGREHGHRDGDDHRDRRRQGHRGLEQVRRPAGHGQRRADVRRQRRGRAQRAGRGRPSPR